MKLGQHHLWAQTSTENHVSGNIYSESLWVKELHQNNTYTKSKGKNIFPIALLAVCDEQIKQK